MTQAVFRRQHASHGRFLRLRRSRGLPKVLWMTNLRGRPSMLAPGTRVRACVQASTVLHGVINRQSSIHGSIARRADEWGSPGCEPAGAGAMAAYADDAWTRVRMLPVLRVGLRRGRAAARPGTSIASISPGLETGNASHAGPHRSTSASTGMERKGSTAPLGRARHSFAVPAPTSTDGSSGHVGPANSTVYSIDEDMVDVKKFTTLQRVVSHIIPFNEWQVDISWLTRASSTSKLSRCDVTGGERVAGPRAPNPFQLVQFVP